MILKELSIEEFNAFTNNNNYSIYQTTNYAELMTNQSFNTFYYGILENNKIYGASMILIKKLHGFKYGFVPRGFIIDYSNLELLKEFTTLLKKELSKKGIVAIKINPPILKSIYKDNKITENNNINKILNNLKSIGFNHQGYSNYFEGVKPRFEAVIPLNKNSNLLFNNISKKFKTKIRAADTNGIKIFKGNEKNIEDLFSQIQHKKLQDLAFLKETYNIFHKNNQVELYYSLLNSADYVRSVQYKYQYQTQICNRANDLVFKNVKKNNNKYINRKLVEEQKLATIKEDLVYATKLLKNNPNGIITSTALILKNKKNVYLVMDGYDQKYKRFNSKHLLIWKLIEKFNNEGYHIFSLGSISNYNIKENKYQGLNEFKLSFGSIAYEYIGDFELIINKPLYIMYKNSSSVMKLLKK